MVKKIRVGLLGGSGVYGWGGRAHAPAIAALPEYELVAVGTSNPETAAKAAQDLNAPMVIVTTESLSLIPKSL